VSRIISSPVKAWPGSVTIRDPLLWPEFITLHRAILLSKACEADEAEKATLLLPGLCAMVEEWHLIGLGALTPETWPASPLKDSFELIGWLMAEAGRLMAGAEEVPNA